MQSQHNARATLARLWGNADKDSCGGVAFTALDRMSTRLNSRPLSCAEAGFLLEKSSGVLVWRS